MRGPVSAILPSDPPKRAVLARTRLPASTVVNAAALLAHPPELASMELAAQQRLAEIERLEDLVNWGAPADDFEQADSVENLFSELEGLADELKDITSELDTALEQAGDLSELTVSLDAANW
jgi:hypothetical protein